MALAHSWGFLSAADYPTFWVIGICLLCYISVKGDRVLSKRVFSHKRESMMEEASLFALPEGMRVARIQITEYGLFLEVEASHPTSCCPLCTQPSDSIKTHYRRVLRDAPCAGRQVQLILTMRKFYCRNLYCSQKVFTERLSTFVEPWARMTIRCCQHIASIGLATCGKGGARLADRLGIHTTRPTILRRIMDLPDVSTGSVVYLGIDDFAFRRGYRFGTILVNLENHRVIDLLPDRQARTAARWMYQQPDLAVISRDRGGEYASAAREGSPQAIQCADRFHIVKNVIEAVQVLLARCQAEILAEKKPEEPDSDEQQNKPIISIEEWRPPEPAHVEKVRLARRAGRVSSSTVLCPSSTTAVLPGTSSTLSPEFVLYASDNPLFAYPLVNIFAARLAGVTE
jgi:transposase